MVKAAAGGGGKGMRLVPDAASLAEALAAARREAQQAFGSAELILERALMHPRHVEIQLIGDQHGNLIHLGERECSIQRRHQKVIEETPSPAVDAALRVRMGETAVRAARTVQYYNAGTVEFLLDETNTFYFLEMNTRLQVEHPVTELVTGIDLVEWQIRVAEGEVLPLTQEQVQWQGHAIEARVYAENPANDFLPVTGRVRLWQPPSDEGIRVDNGIYSGESISIHYDPLLAKIIAHGADRHTAVRRLRRALETAVLLGFTHNLPYLQAILSHSEFQAGRLHTHFLLEHLADWQPPDSNVALALLAATIAQFESHTQLLHNQGYWRNNPGRPQLYRYEWGGEVVAVWLTAVPYTKYEYRLKLADLEYTATLHEFSDTTMVLTVDGVRQKVTIVHNDGRWWLQNGRNAAYLREVPLLPEPQPAADAAGSLRAPMPGAVLAVLVEVGQAVTKGQPLMKLEAMKMEHTIRAAGDGLVEEIYYVPGDSVEADDQLLKIKTMH
jgi:acetyl/propionyl-CoA carboxylase alpha subunit